jgi:hypothetical protein
VVSVLDCNSGLALEFYECLKKFLIIVMGRKARIEFGSVSKKDLACLVDGCRCSVKIQVPMSMQVQALQLPCAGRPLLENLVRSR